MITKLIAIASGALKIVNMILDFITAERLKQIGIDSQRLENEQALNKLHKAADDARKNPPSGNIIDSL